MTKKARDTGHAQIGCICQSWRNYIPSPSPRPLAAAVKSKGKAMNENIQEQFSFQRMGGIDQVTLATDYDWQHLSELDPKLWMALSCPIVGLEFDAATLAQLDADKDGRIRAQEVKEGVAWLCERLRHPAEACKGVAAVSLDNLRQDTEGGVAIAAALRLALEKCGKNDAEPLELAECEAVLAEAANYAFNGDGIVTIPSARESGQAEQMTEFLRLGLAIVGGKRDASGLPGLDQELAAEVSRRASSVLAWRGSLKNASLPLGEHTGAAYTLLQRLGPKLDDFFGRCSLAAYAPETVALLNEEKSLAALLGSEEGAAPQTRVTEETLSKLPLGRVNASGKLNLGENINPAWVADIAEFRRLFAAYLDPDNLLSAVVWKEIKDKFAEYSAILEKKPNYDSAPADAAIVSVPGLPQLPALAEAAADDPLNRAFLPCDVNTSLDELGDEQLEFLTSAKTGEDFDRLVQMDEKAPPLTAFQDLRKLALYNGHLYRFLMNFLSFLDFYNPERKAIFQSGTLYLDSRGCTLCVPVENIDSHALLADQSYLCLIYCQCTRKEADGAERQCHIAAALTAGHLAGLMDGRHGLFIDNAGKEWDTRIVRIVHNPVSIGEAVWSPYIRIGNMASQQLQKFISAKDETVTKLTGETAASIAKGAKAEKGGFDFAKGAGIFAAVSVAISVVSAAFAYIAHSVASLGWYWPLALVGVFLCISAPSVILAWLKLRKRNLGHLLDASGWAVNKGAPINLAMGAALTSIGKMPSNARCNLDDPYSLPGKILRKKWKTRIWLLVIFLILAACGGFVLYCLVYGEPMWVFTARAFLGV